MSRFLLAAVLAACSCFFQVQVVSAEEYYVAISYGNDSNDGLSQQSAFRTIAKASESMESGDTCYIRYGYYTETIVPSCDDVTYRPYLDERPVIVAGRQLSETQAAPSPTGFSFARQPWTKARNWEVPGADSGGGDMALNAHVWKMVIPDDFDLSTEFESHDDTFTTDGRFSQLFVRDVAMVEARWPNIEVQDDAATPTLVHMPRKHAQFLTNGTRLLHTDITDANFHGGLNGAKVHIVPGAEWVPFTTTISNFGKGGFNFDFPLAVDIKRPEPANGEDPADPNIRHNYGWDYWPGNANTGASSYIPEQGDPFFLFDHINLLDAAGEWYIKPKDTDLSGNYSPGPAVIYFWCPFGNPNLEDVYTKQSGLVAIINARSDVKLRDLRFLGGGVSMFGSNQETHDNAVVNCSFRYVNHSRDCLGYQTDTWSGNSISGLNNRFSYCRIEHAGRTGIRDRGTDSLIAGCVVTDVDYDGAHTGAIRLANGSNGASVWHNTLNNSGRHIIYFEGAAGFNIAHNECSHAGFISSDCGNIYTWGTDHGGGQIHHNFVHHNHAAHFPAGIYFDAFGEFADDDSRLASSQNCSVFKNYVSDIDYTAFYIVSTALNINLYNNTHDATSTVGPEENLVYYRDPIDSNGVPGAIQLTLNSSHHGFIRLHQIDSNSENINAYMKSVECARIFISDSDSIVEMIAVLPSAFDQQFPSFHKWQIQVVSGSIDSLSLTEPLSVNIKPEPISLRHHEHKNSSGNITIADWTDCKMVNNIFNGIIDPIDEKDDADRLPLWYDRNYQSDLYPNGLPKPNTMAIDSAHVLPGINTPFANDGPECGCYEVNQNKWLYGHANSGLPEPMEWWLN